MISSLITGCAISYVEKSPNINEDKWVKKLGELTHTKLSITTMMPKDREQKMLQMFATNDLPDVVQTGFDWKRSKMCQSPFMIKSCLACLDEMNRLKITSN
ncbi:hypothetical protein [Paenibacillus periandrae]|uniref:hypothetical protein n=1 Tax=Paenibacillus periandrae TaxID=1761741 RepID=UPI001F09A033|nr:hypothetical protein [Paenibacillus periandrae]